MKNQPFHPRKIRIQEKPELDYDQLKSRTIAALNKLGQQRFSAEPGGYSLENWTRGVNILLDEYERKMGEGKLPPDYLAKRRELEGLLSRPVSTPAIDEGIAVLGQKAAEVEGKIEAGRTLLVSRIAELKGEQERSSAELAQEQRKLSAPITESSDSFLKRLFGGSPKTPTGSSESHIKELESRLESQTNEILVQHKLLKSIDQHSPESPFAEEWKALESLKTSQEALQSERLERVQLVKERQEITASMADMISRTTDPSFAG